MKIDSIIKPFRTKFDPEDLSTRNRLCEAFKNLQDQIDSSGASSSANKYYTKAFNNGAVATVTAVALPIPYNAETSQNGGMHSSTTQNTRFTIKRAGLYTIIANVQWAAALVGYRLLQIKVNGANIIASRIDYAGAVAVIQDQIVVGSDYFNVGDYIEIIATQTSGGALNLASVANFSPYVMVMEN